MSGLRIVTVTSLALLAFAGNSLLCRLALKLTNLDAASFTSIRLMAGAATLWFIVQTTRHGQEGKGNWISAAALFVYAAGFSFAYTLLNTATGALLLFGAVQATMIGYGTWAGERLRPAQAAGLALAVIGLVALLFPGLSAPPLKASFLMICAGIAWALYSLRGRGTGDPTKVTAGNFLRAVPMAIALSLLMRQNFAYDTTGLCYAIASGAVTSGIGYAIWYTAIPSLKATNAATLQLSVPVLAAIGGVIFLGEHLTLRVVGASLAILGGIALVILKKKRAS
jgi:drug/metabolite transporter (DMT)-like permease